MDATALTPDALRDLADRLESRRCTGVSATWCPVCGDCTCPTLDAAGKRTLDDTCCPLHASDSSHAAAGACHA